MPRCQPQDTVKAIKQVAKGFRIIIPFSISTWRSRRTEELRSES